MTESDPELVWQEALAGWAIPPAILAAAPESPWTLPRALFASRADAQLAAGQGIALARAGQALGSGGTLLDVGAGAGAASLPLAALASALTAVDQSAGMLEDLGARAEALGLPVTVVAGRWPDVAAQTPVADVAVCNHVLYNVPNLGPFLRELDAHARRRVVVEISASHPTAPLNPLWLRFHGLERPLRPTWEDALAVMRWVGIEPFLEQESGHRPAPPGMGFQELVAWTARRLCLGPDRDAEVEAALIEMGVDPDRPETWLLGQRERVVLWWDRPSRSVAGGPGPGARRWAPAEPS